MSTKEDREKERVIFDKRLKDLQVRMGYTFVRGEWLREALTHSSYAHEEPGKPSYERLEFLGDRVLELFVCEQLFEQCPDREGDLTKRLAWLVDEESLALAGKKLKLDHALRTGPAVPKERVPDSIVADVLEALVGAIYLDGKEKAARRFVLENVWDPEALGSEPLKASPKNLLQERCDELRGLVGDIRPEFTCEESGPDHQRSFSCCVRVKVAGEVMEASSRGKSSKKAAEKAAAEALLKCIEERFPSF